MNNNYYSRICRRTDGSVYIDKNRFWKDFLGGAAIILLLSSIFTAIVLFALVDPSGSEAQRLENTSQSGEISYQRRLKSAE